MFRRLIALSAVDARWRRLGLRRNSTRRLRQLVQQQRSRMTRANPVALRARSITSVQCQRHSMENLNLGVRAACNCLESLAVGFSAASLHDNRNRTRVQKRHMRWGGTTPSVTAKRILQAAVKIACTAPTAPNPNTSPAQYTPTTLPAHPSATNANSQPSKPSPQPTPQTSNPHAKPSIESK